MQDIDRLLAAIAEQLRDAETRAELRRVMRPALEAVMDREAPPPRPQQRKH